MFEETRYMSKVLADGQINWKISSVFMDFMCLMKLRKLMVHTSQHFTLIRTQMGHTVFCTCIFLYFIATTSLLLQN
jgi:hypothetical protein